MNHPSCGSLIEEAKVLSLAHKDLPASPCNLITPYSPSHSLGFSCTRLLFLLFLEHFRQVWKLRAFALLVLLPGMLFPQISALSIPSSSRLYSRVLWPLTYNFNIPNAFCLLSFIDFPPTYLALSDKLNTLPIYFLPIFFTRSNTMRQGFHFFCSRLYSPVPGVVPSTISVQ